MIYQRTIARARNVMYAFAAVCLLAQCSEEDEMIQPSIPTETMEAQASLPASVSSLTITGENTIVSEAEVDCKTCTYVVTEHEQTVDGNELSLPAGSIICLDKAVKYGDLEFVNFVGSEKQPIVIGYTNFPTNK